MTASTVSISHVGPIRDTFEFALKPGLSVLTGSPGSGKSTVLRATELLLGCDVELSVTDGVRDGGAVEGFGRRMPVGTRKRAKGDVELDHLDFGRFNLGDIIEPKEKDPAARDRKRISALAQMTGGQLTEDAIAEVVGRELLTDLGVKIDADDPVGTVGRVKRAIERLAGQNEAIVENENAHAAQHAAKAEGIDTDQPCDAAALQGNLEAALNRKSELDRELDAHTEQQSREKSAREKLEQFQSAYDGPTVESATESAEMAGRIVDELRKQLDEAEKKQQDALLNLRRAKDYEASIASCREILKEPVILRPEQAGFDEADKQIVEAREAVETGVRVRDALSAIATSEQHQLRAKEAAKSATKYRDLAHLTQALLGDVIGADDIYVGTLNGDVRVMTRHEKREPEECAFDELSEAERVNAVLQLVLPKLKAPAIATLSQTWTQHLPVEWRKRIHEQCVERGIILLCAEVGEGPLTVHNVGENGKS